MIEEEGTVVEIKGGAAIVKAQHLLRKLHIKGPLPKRYRNRHGN
jgi:hypothetical protein